MKTIRLLTTLVILGTILAAPATMGLAATATTLAASGLTPAPANLQGWAGNAVVKIWWDAPAGPSTAAEPLGYRVCRWENQPSGEPAIVATLPVTETSFFDYQVASNRTYIYTVRALYEDKAESRDSNRLILVPQVKNLNIVLTLGQERATVNGAAVTLDSPAQLVADRTMVPLRFVSASLGATVDYDSGARRVTATLGSRVVKLWIDETQADIDGLPKSIDTPPVIRSGRTLVPIRFIAEAFGADVGFDRPTGRITVTLADRDATSPVAWGGAGSSAAPGALGAGQLVMPGLPVKAALSGADDVDLFSCPVTPGATYQVRTDTLAPGCDTVLGLVDPADPSGPAGRLSQAVDDWPLGAVRSELRFTAPAGVSQVYLRVQSAMPGTYGVCGNYRLVVEKSVEADDTPAGAVTLAADGEARTGSLHEATDIDYYSFRAAEGKLYRITARPTTAGFGLVLDLLTGEGEPLSRDDDPEGRDGGGAAVVWECASDGNYLLALRSRTGNSGSYSLEMEEVTAGSAGSEDLIDDSAGSNLVERYRTAQPVIVDFDRFNQWLTSPTDQDWFRFTAARGKRYYIQTTGLGGWGDTVLTLYSAGGVELAACDDAPGFARPEGGSLVSWVATDDGPVYARVTAYQGTPPTFLGVSPAPAAGLGRYSFCVTTAAPETDDLPATATELNVGASTPGGGTSLGGSRFTASLTTGDSDWYSFSVVRGRTYTIATSDLKYGADTCLELYWESGRLLASSDDVATGNPASLIIWPATYTGTVYVRVYPFASPDGSQGTGLYTLVVAAQ